MDREEILDLIEQDIRIVYLNPAIEGVFTAEERIFLSDKGVISGGRIVYFDELEIKKLDNVVCNDEEGYVIGSIGYNLRGINRLIRMKSGAVICHYGRSNTYRFVNSSIINLAEFIENIELFMSAYYAQFVREKSYEVWESELNILSLALHNYDHAALSGINSFWLHYFDEIRYEY
jgi:SUKH-4 immunity protein